jgi:hypothetical protein
VNDLKIMIFGSDRAAHEHGDPRWAFGLLNKCRAAVKEVAAPGRVIPS